MQENNEGSQTASKEVGWLIVFLAAVAILGIAWTSGPMILM